MNTFTSSPNILIELAEASQYSTLGSLSFSIVEVPESFLKGLSDCESGRVVDMDKALSEPFED